MLNNEYELRYLPIFYEDLNRAVTYIVSELKNTKAGTEIR